MPAPVSIQDPTSPNNNAAVSADGALIVRTTPAAGALAATSGLKANAVASATLGGTTSTQLAGLTQMIVTSSGATAAATVTLTISGISTAQISGSTLNMMFGVPTGAGVPATPLVVNFEPPLLPAVNGAVGAIKAELSALGSGHTGASITLLGRLTAP